MRARAVVAHVPRAGSGKISRRRGVCSQRMNSGTDLLMDSATEKSPAAPAQAALRAKAPVFVLGCPRSGTTVLYHMLLSAGNFAVYRVESNAINLIEPAFGDLSIQ